MSATYILCHDCLTFSAASLIGWSTAHQPLNFGGIVVLLVGSAESSSR
jgi:hypothetical protein